MDILIMFGLAYVVYRVVRASAEATQRSERVDPPARDSSDDQATERETDVNEYGEIVDRYR